MIFRVELSRRALSPLRNLIFKLERGWQKNSKKLRSARFHAVIESSGAKLMFTA